MMEQVHEQQEAQREASKLTSNQPFRFFVPVRETREICIVDDQPTFWRWEHALKDNRSGRWDLFVPCIDEIANCPACAKAERPKYFAMYLTIIDFTPYTDKDGNEVAFSKKLLVIKPMQQKKITRLMDKQGAGSLRGMVLEMSRDAKTDASIGDPGFVEILDEDTLLSYETSYVDKENKVHDVICHEPFDYDALFPAMDEDTLQALVGGGGNGVGSRRADDRSLGRGSSRAAPADDWQDDTVADAAPQRRVASRTSRAAPEDDYQESQPPARRPAARGRAEPAEDVDYSEQATTRRPARGRTVEPDPEPARRPARRGAASRDVIDPDDNPETGTDGDAPWAEDAPAARPAQRGARRAMPEPEDARPAVDRSARRAGLRR